MLSDISTSGSISLWIHEVQGGSRSPIRQLLERYLPRLIALAQSKLRDKPRLTGYAEDVALGVFNQLCLGIEQGRFPNLTCRKSAWQLLAVMTIRRTIDLKRKSRRQEQLADGSLSAISSDDTTPDAQAEMEDRVRQLLDRLNDPQLREIALLKGAGYENEEIAARLGCGLRTVERKLQKIRERWQAECGGGNSE